MDFFSYLHFFFFSPVISCIFFKVSLKIISVRAIYYNIQYAQRRSGRDDGDYTNERLPGLTEHSPKVVLALEQCEAFF